MERTPLNKTRIENMTVEEIFSDILSRQIQALMYHEQWAIMFDFLALTGFRSLHEWRYISESQTMRNIQKWYIGNHDRLIPEKKVNPVFEIPDDWYSAKRTDATPKNVSQFTERICQSHVDWETETVDFLSAYAKRLTELSEFNDLSFVQEMIKDTSHELKKAKVLLLALSSVNWDGVYIQEMQKDFRKEYKKKLT